MYPNFCYFCLLVLNWNDIPVFCPECEDETGDGERGAGQAAQEEHVLSHHHLHHQTAEEWQGQSASEGS